MTRRTRLREAFSELVGNWSLVLSIVLSAVVAILSFVPAAERLLLPFLVLLIVSFVCYQIGENNRRRQEVERTAGLIDSHVVYAHSIGQPEFYIYLKQAVERAKQSIDTTNLEIHTPEKHGIPEKTQYYQALKRTLRNRDVRFRRIVSIPTKEKLDWVEKWLREFGDRPNCSLAYVSLGAKSPSDLLFLPLNMQIVDRNEVLIVNIGTAGHRLAREDVDFRICGREAATYFAIYYDQFWEKAVKLKEGADVYWDVLESIKKELSS